MAHLNQGETGLLPMRRCVYMRGPDNWIVAPLILTDPIMFSDNGRDGLQH